MSGTGASQLRSVLLERRKATVLRDLAGRERTGAELLDRVERLAGTLHEAGLVGERVGVWYSNSIAAFEAYLAVEWVGGTRVVVDPTVAPAEAAAILDAAGAGRLLVDRERAALAPVGAIVHDDEHPSVAPPRAPLAVPGGRTLHLYPRAVQGGELFAIPISYANWHAAVALNCELYRSGRYGGGWSEEGEVMLTVQQLLHGTGLMGSFPFLHMGLAQVIADRFDPAEAADAIARFGVTATGMTSGMLALFVERLGGDGGARRSLRRVIYGGAPLALEQLRRAAAVLGPVLVQVYGRLEEAGR